MRRLVGLAAAIAATQMMAGCGPPPKPLHQWAMGADASSYAADPSRPGAFSAASAIGPADVMACGDNPNAWAPASANPGVAGPDDYLELTYQRYVRVSDLYIYESYNPGGIVAVDLIASDASSPTATIFDNPAGDGASVGCPTVYHLSIDQGTTPGYYNRVRIYIDSDITGDTNGINGLADDYNEIDAVELVGRR